MEIYTKRNSIKFDAIWPTIWTYQNKHIIREPLANIEYENTFCAFIEWTKIPKNHIFDYGPCRSMNLGLLTKAGTKGKWKMKMFQRKWLDNLGITLDLVTKCSQVRCN